MYEYMYLYFIGIRLFYFILFDIFLYYLWIDVLIGFFILMSNCDIKICVLYNFFVVFYE